MTIFVYAWRESDVDAASIVVKDCDEPEAAAAAIRSALSPFLSTGAVIEVRSLNDKAIPDAAAKVEREICRGVGLLAEMCADPRKAAA